MRHKLTILRKMSELDINSQLQRETNLICAIFLTQNLLDIKSEFFCLHFIIFCDADCIVLNHKLKNSILMAANLTCQFSPLH